jgi:hypothetical protein
VNSANALGPPTDPSDCAYRNVLAGQTKNLALSKYRIDGVDDDAHKPNIPAGSTINGVYIGIRGTHQNVLGCDCFFWLEKAGWSWQSSVKFSYTIDGCAEAIDGYEAAVTLSVDEINDETYTTRVEAHGGTVSTGRSYCANVWIRVVYTEPSANKPSVQVI